MRKKPLEDGTRFESQPKPAECCLSSRLPGGIGLVQRMAYPMAVSPNGRLPTLQLKLPPPSEGKRNPHTTKRLLLLPEGVSRQTSTDERPLPTSGSSDRREEAFQPPSSRPERCTSSAGPWWQTLSRLLDGTGCEPVVVVRDSNPLQADYGPAALTN
jgi:hypothetical protein